MFDFVRFPSVEKRRILGVFKNRAFQGEMITSQGGVRIKNDDLYVYYLMLERSFFTALALLILYITSYYIQSPLDLYIFSIDATITDLIEVSFVSFTKQVAFAIFFVLLPLHILQFAANHNLWHFDFYAWNPDHKPIPMNKSKRLRSLLLGWGLLALGVYLPSYIFLYIRQIFHLDQSLIYFLFSSLVVCLLVPVFARYLLFVSLVVINLLEKNIK